MRLDEHYSIEKDAHSWNLVYEKLGPERNAKGELTRSHSVSYHANLKQALTKYLDVSLEGSTEAQSVITAISDAEQRIAKALEASK